MVIIIGALPNFHFIVAWVGRVAAIAASVVAIVPRPDADPVSRAVCRGPRGNRHELSAPAERSALAWDESLSAKRLHLLP